MTGKDLLLSAVRGERTPRPAWLPYVGVHGGKLIGVDAADYLRSPQHIADGLAAARDRYRPDGLPVTFDLQLEAEVLGCALQWADKTPPSVVSHPMSLMEGEGRPLDHLPPFSVEAGRFPVVFDAMARARRAFRDEVALYGLLTGPFTLALHLMGNDVFMAMFDDPEGLSAVIDHCAGVGCAVAEAYAARGADVIAVVDPMTSQISPEHFARFVTPSVNRVFDAIHAAGPLASMFVCGDATRNLQAMADTRADNVAIDEQIPLDTVRGLTRPRGKSFGGNLKLTTVLLMGDEAAAKRDAVRCIDTAGDTGFVLAPGCDLPYDVKPGNLAAVATMVHDPYQRDVARATLTADTAEELPDVELPDYAAEDAVIVDVITLDSASCAPCQYMFRAALDARGRLGSATAVEVREHKITTPQGVGMMVKLGVPNLPSICIDGRCAFASITPDTRVLADAIVHAAEAKRGGAGGPA